MTRLRAGGLGGQGNILAAATPLRDECTPRATARPAPFIARNLPTPGCNSATTTPMHLDDQAADAYESAGRLDVEAPEWRSKAARATERNGRPGEAVQHYRRSPNRPRNTAPSGSALAGQLSRPDHRRPPNATGTISATPSKGVDNKANGVSLYLLEADYSAADGQLDQAVKVLQPSACESAEGVGVVAGPGRDAGAGKGRRGSRKQALAGSRNGPPRPKRSRSSRRGWPWRPAASTRRENPRLALARAVPTRASRSSPRNWSSSICGRGIGPRHGNV